MGINNKVDFLLCPKLRKYFTMSHQLNYRSSSRWESYVHAPTIQPQAQNVRFYICSRIPIQTHGRCSLIACLELMCICSIKWKRIHSWCLLIFQWRDSGPYSLKQMTKILSSWNIVLTGFATNAVITIF